jgi:uncharacterized protein with PIN domain
VEWLWYGVILTYVLGIVVRLWYAMRTPRCHSCRIRAIALTYQIGETLPPIFQVVYRCPRCRVIIWKHFVNVLTD